jgi:hypothetical protein
MLSKWEIAKQLCEEMGITWNENATEPTVNGKVIDRKVNFKELFSTTVVDDFGGLFANIPIIHLSKLELIHEDASTCQECYSCSTTNSIAA